MSTCQRTGCFCRKQMLLKPLWRCTFVMCASIKKKQVYRFFFLNQKEQKFNISLRMLTFIYIWHTYTVYMYKTLLSHCCETVALRLSPGGHNLTALTHAGPSDSMCRFIWGVRMQMFWVPTHTYSHNEAQRTEERKKSTPASAKNSASSTAAWQNITPPPQNDETNCRNTSGY